MEAGILVKYDLGYDAKDSGFKSVSCQLCSLEGVPLPLSASVFPSVKWKQYKDPAHRVTVTASSHITVLCTQTEVTCPVQGTVSMNPRATLLEIILQLQRSKLREVRNLERATHKVALTETAQWHPQQRVSPMMPLQ